MRPPDWPAHLIERKGYFTWRDPRTGDEYGLGRDYVKAKAQADEANRQLVNGTLAAKIATPQRTLGSFLPIYRKHLTTIAKATRTEYSIRSSLKAIETHLADVPIGTRFEDAPAVAERCFTFLDDTYVKAGKRRMAKVVRARLLDLFACMISRGWLAVNPVRDLKLPAPSVKRQRLTLEAFWAIYAVAPQVAPWLPRAMELGLVTIQRREEVANMTFRAIDAERLKVVQQKTGARLRIPTTLRLDAVGWSLDDIVKRCRDLVVSQHLVHHVAHQGQAKPGMRVHPTTISAAFSEARKLAGIAVEPGKTPPTFHELRSLGIRLYRDEDYNPQELAGHKQESTTALYADGRGVEWIEVRTK